MKKTYRLKIVIDDAEGVSGFRLPRWPFDSSLITVYRTRLLPGTHTADHLAHELGHSIGWVFKTPGWNSDPRVQAQHSFLGFNIPPLAKISYRLSATWASEFEAWHFAEKVRPIFQKLKKHCLATYGWTKDA